MFLIDCESNPFLMFGMRFAPKKCKMLPQYWVGSKPNLVPAREQLDEGDKFSYWDGCTSPSGRTSNEAPSRVQKTRLVFGNLRSLWRRRDIRSSIRGWVYTATARPMLLYDYGTAENI